MELEVTLLDAKAHIDASSPSCADSTALKFVCKNGQVVSRACSWIVATMSISPSKAHLRRRLFRRTLVALLLGAAADVNALRARCQSTPLDHAFAGVGLAAQFS
mmetsp:Transcript_37997/g.88932  ORF Transcript_37997/g.88932 Transcript_37997/m.88932 type:complete len:104 (-) Transcript_37997:136-447(-)